MQLPTWDVFIGLFFLVGIAYGFILKRDKTITTLCSVYVGLVIANSFSETLYKFFQGDSTIADQVWIKSNASVSTIAIVLFILSILFISKAINASASKSSELSIFEVLIYSSLTVALIVASILSFLPEASRIAYTDQSRVASIIYNLKTWIILAGPLLLVVFNMRGKSK